MNAAEENEEAKSTNIKGLHQNLGNGFVIGRCVF